MNGKSKLTASLRRLGPGFDRFRPCLERLEDRLTPTNLPAGFSETLITSSGATLNRPTAMEFSPTGQLWVLQQGGTVKVVNFATGGTSTAGSLTVDSSGERGLLGIAFRPEEYDGAGPLADFVYLYYTTQSSPHNRVSKFQVNDAGTATPTLGTEEVILNIAGEAQGDGSSNHNGGAIHFGPDGKLYIAVGDHNADGTGFQGSQHVSQRLNSQHGKILRINPDSTYPTDNPFFQLADPTSIRSSVYALGLRNPYTFAFQPASGRLFINDVGEGTWEEINDGIAGSNYGWASETTPGGFAEGFESAGSLPGYLDPPANGIYRNPIMAYDHGGGGANGCAITGGVFYPTGSSFGSFYGGKYFFADFCDGYIRLFDPADPGSVGDPDTSTGFAGNLTTSSPVDLKVDAAGNLYYLARGGGSDTGEIYRISFNAPGITDQPDDITVTEGQSASFSVAASGGAPLSFQWQRFVSGSWTDLANGGAISGVSTATLTINPTMPGDTGQYRCVVTNSAGSAASNAATLTINVLNAPPTITDEPDDLLVHAGQSATFNLTAIGSAPLSYQWQRADSATPAVFADIPGANAASYTLVNAQSADDGDLFRCVVTNAFGDDTSATATLTVNELPTATITPDSLTYIFGQVISFSGVATDAEDGTLGGAAFTWSVEFGHDGHTHPHLGEFSGVDNGQFTANFIEPDPDQFYRILLTVTDSNGGTFTTTVDIQPITAMLDLVSDPAGAPLTMDGQLVSGPVPSVVGSTRSITAPVFYLNGDTPQQFVSWSDAGAATHDIVTPAVDTTYTASYQSGLAVHVNFQPASSPGFAGYLADTGAVFGDRDNGYRYGWSKNNTAMLDRNAVDSPDERYDTLARMQAVTNKFWEIEVPAGLYEVRIVAGDPTKVNSVFRIKAEGLLAVKGKPSATNRWLDRTVTVAVTDGRLSIRNGQGAINNKLNFIDVTWLSPPPAPLLAAASARDPAIVNTLLRRLHSWTR